MADDFPRDRPHLFLGGNGAIERYQRPPRRIEPRPLPARDRAAHAAALEAAMGAALVQARERLDSRDAAVATGVPGFYLEVEIPLAERDVIDQLGDRGKHLEVVAVRQPVDDGPVLASVFIPTAAEDYYARKIEAYKTQDTPSHRPKNERLLTRIDTVRLATVRSLFTDEDRLFPQAVDQQIWWEVWLREDRREAFENVARALGAVVKQHAVHFPEREVILCLADLRTLERLMVHSDAVAELRRAKDTPAMFMHMDGAHQRAWVENLVDRIVLPEPRSAVVCILDSGVNRAHPMLAPALAPGDCHTINPAWGTDDTADLQGRGHATSMAGVALYGDIVPVLVGGDPVELPYRLESVRILPPMGQANDPELYGAITAEAVARAEVQAPHRQRAIALAVTSITVNGRPSSWSAAIDQLCCEEASPRLLILSAGNIRDDYMLADHPDRNDVEALEDPAQSWNALTVGAFTEKVDIVDPDFVGYRPIAPAGDLSPCSRTSVMWERQWPLKPEVVFEGGNLAHDGAGPGDNIDDLQLLTTHFRPEIRPFTTFGDTSAAVALAARMAGSILATRPDLWPETVRALIVHSAEWSPAMRERLAACNGNRRRLEAFIRRYGYGVPDLDRALRSTRNDLSLVIEDTLQPFARDQAEEGRLGPTAKLRDMKLHQLPWPRDELRALGAAEVELRATLSYFVEPNPGERGWRRRHRYASHGLRFSMKSSTESLQEFRARINQVAREEEEGLPGNGGAEDWTLGVFRDKGSLHSDFWHGSAVDLAERDAIAVFPVGGWWKEKLYLDRWDRRARYALIVTIRAPNADVDIYTPVATQIAVPVEITRE